MCMCIFNLENYAQFEILIIFDYLTYTFESSKEKYDKVWQAFKKIT